MRFFIMVCICVFVYSSLGFSFVDDGLEPPINTHLADSPWPMSHRNPYCQHSSPHPGPINTVSSKPVQHASADWRSVPVTLALSGKYSSGESVAWASTHRGVFKLSIGSGDWKVASAMNFSDKAESIISGAYSVLDSEGVFFTAHNTSIEAFADLLSDNAQSPMKKLRSFVLRPSVVREGESIIGLNLTYDGYLAFVTDYGLVGVVSRDFKVSKVLRLRGDIEVSNSLALDEDGGIYVVTSKAMNRLTWREGNLTLTWSVPYKTTNTLTAGRLGLGSGTTPALMGTGDSDKLVVIADGQKLMHMVAFWRDQIPADWAGLPGRDRRIAAEVPIRFGNPKLTTTITEQSLVVRGYEAVAVNNNYGVRRPGKLARFLTILESHRIAPKGVEKFAWDPATRKLTSIWANTTTSCPNGIPTMSAETQMFYCVGAHESQWTFEALDWKTGKNAWRKTMGSESSFNSFYAATEVGWDSSLISGAFQGFLRVQ